MAAPKGAGVKPADPKAPTFAKVKVGDLVVDKRVQRSRINPTHINKIVAEFNPTMLGVIIVSRRPNGTYVALDGWHRSEAVKLVRDAPTELDALVYTGMSLAQEAEMFRRYNTRATVPNADNFRMLVHEGDEMAVRVNAIVENFGLEIGKTFHAVATAAKIVGRPNGFETFETTLRIIDRAWTLDENSADNRIINAIAEMIYHYDDAFDEKAFTTRLAAFDGGLATILEKSRVYHRSVANPGPMLRSIINVALLPIYNKNMREDKVLDMYNGRKRKSRAAKLEEVEA
jgi:hypothetical protein